MNKLWDVMEDLRKFGEKCGDERIIAQANLGTQILRKEKQIRTFLETVKDENIPKQHDP